MTAELVEDKGKTILTSALLHPTKEIREANLQMELGAAETYDKPEKYLASIA